jgi:hypothetical protein
METLPTHDELCAHFGYRLIDEGVRISEGNVKPRPMSVRADSQAEGWTFTMTARSRGWIVSDPQHNGMPGDTHFVTVWAKGPYDEMADGRYRRG